MRFEFLAGLWVVLGLASLPLAPADTTMNEWNQLMIDQFFAGFSPFVSTLYYVWLGMWRKGEGCAVMGERGLGTMLYPHTIAQTRARIAFNAAEHQPCHRRHAPGPVEYGQGHP